MSENIYNLTELNMIGGSYQVLEFTVYDENNQPINLNGATCTWYLRSYGNYAESAVLVKSGSVTGTNTFEVVLSSSDTINLYGKYVQQPVVQDYSGKTFRPAQGIIMISKAIQS
jgi:hypothetical protein